jgi:hypothetical protein
MSIWKKSLECIKDYTSVAIISAVITFAFYGGGTSLGGAAIIFTGHFVALAVLVHGASKIIKKLDDDHKR